MLEHQSLEVTSVRDEERNTRAYGPSKDKWRRCIRERGQRYEVLLKTRKILFSSIWELSSIHIHSFVCKTAKSILSFFGVWNICYWWKSQETGFQEPRIHPRVHLPLTCKPRFWHSPLDKIPSTCSILATYSLWGKQILNLSLVPSFTTSEWFTVIAGLAQQWRAADLVGLLISGNLVIWCGNISF